MKKKLLPQNGLKKSILYNIEREKKAHWNEWAKEKKPSNYILRADYLVL